MIHNDAKLEAKGTLYRPSYTLYLQMIVQSDPISELISNRVECIPYYCFLDSFLILCPVSVVELQVSYSSWYVGLLSDCQTKVAGFTIKQTLGKTLL